MKSKQIIAALLAIARENGIPTVKALAEKAGLKRQQVSRYTTGVSDPNLETLIRLAAAAGAEITITKK